MNKTVNCVPKYPESPTYRMQYSAFFFLIIRISIYFFQLPIKYIN